MQKWEIRYWIADILENEPPCAPDASELIFKTFPDGSASDDFIQRHLRWCQGGNAVAKIMLCNGFA
jgi:hypothetical protein